MANIKFFDGYRKGSVAGQTFQKSGQGYIVRSKPIGTQPRSAAQTLQRSRMYNSATSWGNVLTQDQRDGWNNLAAGQTRYDAFGDPYTPSGYQVFQEISGNRQLVNDPLLLDAPDNLVVTALSSAGFYTLYSGDEYFTIEWTPAISDSERLLCKGWVNQPPGLGNHYGRLKYIGYSPAEQVSPFDFEFYAMFKLQREGMRQSCMVAIYNEFNGAISPWLSMTGITGPPAP